MDSRVRHENDTYKKQGFTLIEMSIVLVIIGLIVGGILVGQDLIRAAYIRAQISQIEKFNTAVNTFYGKYQALPGDMNVSTAAANGFAARSGAEGQGDGNGLLEGGSAAFGASLDQCSGENGFFWQDLTYANGMNLNLIDGYLSAAPVGGLPEFNSAPDQVPITYLIHCFPVAKIGNGNYFYVYSQSGSNYYGLSTIPSDPLNPGEFIQGGNPGGTYTAPGLNVQQAYNIDTKVDDGSPLTGNVTVNYLTKPGPAYNTATVIPANGAATGSYNSTTCYDSTVGIYVTNSTINGNGASGLCALSFKMQAGD